MYNCICPIAATQMLGCMRCAKTSAQRPNRTQIETYAEDGDWNFEDEIEGVYIPPDQRAEKEVEKGPRGKGRGRGRKG